MILDINKSAKKSVEKLIKEGYEFDLVYIASLKRWESSFSKPIGNGKWQNYAIGFDQISACAAINKACNNVLNDKKLMH